MRVIDMAELYLIATISGALVAIDAKKVESVVRVDEIEKIPCCSQLVAGLYALRSRVLTIIDSQYLVTGVSKPVLAGSTAVVVSIAGHSYGLIVDKTDDAVTFDEVKYVENVSLDTAWQQITSGVILHKDQLLMIVEIEKLISEPHQLAA
jgi:purine-binding chemotaxis protein CheW